MRYSCQNTIILYSTVGRRVWLLHVHGVPVGPATPSFRIRAGPHAHRHGRLRRPAEYYRPETAHGAIWCAVFGDEWLLQRDACTGLLVRDESGGSSAEECGDGLADWIWK